MGVTVVSFMMFFVCFFVDKKTPIKNSLKFPKLEIITI